MSEFYNLFLVIQHYREAAKRVDIMMTNRTRDWYVIHEPILYHLNQCC
jgi:hypothetical protein